MEGLSDNNSVQKLNLSKNNFTDEVEIFPNL